MSQYIGARYVPKFMGTYDNTQAYENMCVVDNGLGTSYISKVPVPAGTPLTDTNYWALYGASNGAIINLQNQIGDLSSLTTSDQSNLVSALNEVRSDLLNIANRKFVFIGDSYGEGYTYGGDQIDGWLDRIGAVMGLSASQMSQSIAVGGYGFVGSGTPSKQWINLVNAMTADSDVTDVCFIGGGNDIRHANDYTPLANAITSTIAAAKTKFPNARIWVGSCGISFDNIYPDNKLLQLFAIYNDMSTRNGALFMEDIQYVLFNKSAMLPTNHPNDGGQTLLTAAISSVLKGGSYVATYPDFTAATRTEDANVVPASTISNIYFKTFKNKITISSNFSDARWGFVLATPTAFKANGADPIVIGKYENLPMIKTKTILGNLTCNAAWTNGNIRQCNVTLVAEDDYIKAYLYDTNGFNYYNNDLSDTLVFIELPQFVLSTDLVTNCHS